MQNNRAAREALEFKYFLWRNPPKQQREICDRRVLMTAQAFK